MKDKKYYLHMYKDKWNRCLKEAEKDIKENNCSLTMIIDAATEIFEETANAKEVVGFYIKFHGNSALKDWLSNTEGIELSVQDMEVERILKQLYL